MDSARLTDNTTETGGELGVREVRNERAISVYRRVEHKLTGT